MEEAAERFAEEGKTPLWIAVDGSLRASSRSPTRSNPRRSRLFGRCMREGLRVVMLSGDNEHTAKAIAREVESMR